MCDERRNATKEEKEARSVRAASAAEAIRAALYGSPGNLPSHAPETVGELAEVVAGFVYSVDAIVGGGLIRSVLDKLLDAQEMRAGESGGGMDPAVAGWLNALPGATAEFSGTFDTATPGEKIVPLGTFTLKAEDLTPESRRMLDDAIASGEEVTLTLEDGAGVLDLPVRIGRQVAEATGNLPDPLTIKPIAMCNCDDGREHPVGEPPCILADDPSGRPPGNRAAWDAASARSETWEIG